LEGLKDLWLRKQRLYRGPIQERPALRVSPTVLSPQTNA
jgi:hypothetical protein